MIYPKHLLFFPLLFRLYTNWQMKCHFERHVVVHENRPKDHSPLLVVSNHIGWWDGFWVLHINMKHWKRKFYVLMHEKTLKENRWLNYTGAFSLDPRRIRESMNQCLHILKQSQTMLLYFPQGAFQSQYDLNHRFKRGVDYLIREGGDSLEVVFVANLIEYYAHKKPSLFSYCRVVPSPSQTTLREQYDLFYAEVLSQHMQNAEL